MSHAEWAWTPIDHPTHVLAARAAGWTIAAALQRYRDGECSAVWVGIPPAGHDIPYEPVDLGYGQSFPLRHDLREIKP